MNRYDFLEYGYLVLLNSGKEEIITGQSYDDALEDYPRRHEVLEAYEGKLSSTVLRGGSGSNAVLLPDYLAPVTTVEERG